MAGNRTWVDGDVPTAGDFNGYFRDQVITICTSASRPSSPVNGRTIYETDTECYVRYDGGAAAWAVLLSAGAWLSYTPTWASSGTAVALGDGTIAGRYHRSGRMITGNIVFTVGSTTTMGTGFYSFTLPTAMAANGASITSGTFYDLSGTATYPLSPEVTASGTTVFPIYLDDAAPMNAQSATTPVVPAAGDVWKIQFQYEAAA